MLSGASPRMVAAARSTACTGRRYPVSRSRIPDSASRISASVGFAVFSRSAFAARTIAGVE